jgi:BlaI family penicillinase repressor
VNSSHILVDESGGSVIVSHIVSDFPDLNPIELEILGVLWKEAPKKPAEIAEALDRPIENATLRSTLVGMVEQGVLKRERRGKAYFYKPARAARTVRRKLMERLAAVFAEGSRLGLIAQLIQDEKLTPAQIRELERFAEGEDEDAS